jgi:hypothetical protein
MSGDVGFPASIKGIADIKRARSAASAIYGYMPLATLITAPDLV